MEVHNDTPDKLHTEHKPMVRSLKQEAIDLYVNRIPQKLKRARFTYADITACFFGLWEDDTDWNAQSAKEQLQKQLITDEQIMCLNEIGKYIESFRNKFESVVGECGEEECCYTSIHSELSSLVYQYFSCNDEFPQAIEDDPVAPDLYIEHFEEFMTTYQTVSLEYGESLKQDAEDLHSLLQTTFEASKGEKGAESLFTVIRHRVERWSFADFQPDIPSPQARSRAILASKAMELYINKIPRNMKNNGFCAWQILTCYRCIAAGNRLKPLPDVWDEDLINLAQADNDETWAKEEKGRFEKVGLKAYGLWKKVYKHSREQRDYGFTDRQRSCLKIVDEEIQKLESTAQATGHAQEHRRLRRIMCELVYKAIDHLRSEDDPYSTNSYAFAYNSVARELDVNEVTTLPWTWRSTLSTLTSGHMPIVDDMMTTIGAPSAELNATEVTSSRIPAERSHRFAECEWFKEFWTGR